jgi:hypothetical protein
MPKRTARGRSSIVVSLGCFLAAVLAGAAAQSNADEPKAVTEADQRKEVAKLSAAMESFKEKFSAPPPSVADEKQSRRFIIKAFPRARAGTAPPKLFDAAEALPYWLTRVSTNDGMPFVDEKEDVLRYKFIELAEDRLKDGRYYPTSDGKSDPYVYFSEDRYAASKYKNFEPYYVPDAKRKGGKNYLAPNTWQIIGPGKDGKLGRGGSLKELSEEDRDNVVSFAKVVVGEIDWKSVEVRE